MELRNTEPAGVEEHHHRLRAVAGDREGGVGPVGACEVGEVVLDPRRGARAALVVETLVAEHEGELRRVRPVVGVHDVDQRGESPVERPTGRRLVGCACARPRHDEAVDAGPRGLVDLGPEGGGVVLGVEPERRGRHVDEGVARERRGRAAPIGGEHRRQLPACRGPDRAEARRPVGRVPPEVVVGEQGDRPGGNGGGSRWGCRRRRSSVTAGGGAASEDHRGGEPRQQHAPPPLLGSARRHAAERTAAPVAGWRRPGTQTVNSAEERR